MLKGIFVPLSLNMWVTFLLNFDITNAAIQGIPTAERKETLFLYVGAIVLIMCVSVHVCIGLSVTMGFQRLHLIIHKNHLQ